jgi:hydrogenase expression/formation protein HypD
MIPLSGFALQEKYADFDASKKFPTQNKTVESTQNQCLAGSIMKGNKNVSDCPFFGTACTPEHPLGAPMVSEEGVCSAYYRYR